MLKRLKKLDRLFYLIVLLPTALSILYFGLIASPVYISQSSFVVYTPNERGGGQSGLSALLSTLGGSNSNSAAETISNYTQSWSAMESLDQAYNLKKFFGDADIFNRFGGVFHPFTDMVHLWRYYQNMVSDVADPNSGISALVVKAYTAKDAEKINAFLLAKGQTIVNQLNETARQSAVNYAEQDVQEAQEKFKTATLAVAEYRNDQGVYDPNAQSSGQFTLIQQLQGKLIDVTVELSSLEAHAPDNPQIPVLKTTIASLKRQIAQSEQSVTGPGKSLASQDTEYQILKVNLMLAQTLLESSVVSLEQARNTAQKQELYLETISSPNLPDAAEEPKRLEDILAVLIICTMIWGVVRIIIGGVREHKGL